MWRIYEGPRVQKALGMLPKDLLKRYEKWKDIVIISGPQGLRMIKGFHDEKLKGLWRGYRSSRLNLQYRVIYRMQAEQVYVEVFDISAHRY